MTIVTGMHSSNNGRKNSRSAHVHWWWEQNVLFLFLAFFLRILISYLVNKSILFPLVHLSSFYSAHKTQQRFNHKARHFRFDSLRDCVCVCFFSFSIFFININASSQGASEMNTTRHTAIIGELDLPDNIHTHTVNIRLELTPKLFTVLAAFIISCACQKNWCYIRKADLFVDFFLHFWNWHMRQLIWIVPLSGLTF